MTEGIISVWPDYLDSEEKRNLFLHVFAQGLPPSDAIFLCHIVDKLHKTPDMNALELGRIAFMNRSISLVHLKRLQERNFVVRTGHRSWRLSDATRYIMGKNTQSEPVQETTQLR